MDTSTTSSTGIGFCGALFLVLLTLRLLDVIDWSWWLIFAPIWVPFTISIILIIVGLIFIGKWRKF